MKLSWRCVRGGIMLNNSITNRGLIVIVSCDKLWKVLIDKNINRIELKSCVNQ